MIRGDAGLVILTPGGASPGVKYVATQQEPPPPLLPFVVPRGSPTNEKDEIWLLAKSGSSGFVGLQGCKGSGPEPLSQPGYGPIVELRSWNPGFCDFRKVNLCPGRRSI